MLMFIFGNSIISSLFYYWIYVELCILEKLSQVGNYIWMFYMMFFGKSLIYGASI